MDSGLTYFSPADTGGPPGRVRQGQVGLVFAPTERGGLPGRVGLGFTPTERGGLLGKDGLDFAPSAGGLPEQDGL